MLACRLVYVIVDDDTFLSIPRLYRMLDSYRLDQVRAPSRLFEEAPTNHRLRMPHLMKHKCSVDGPANVCRV